MPRKSQRSQSHNTNRSIQQTLESSFQEVNLDIEKQVSDLVRYVVNTAGEHLIFKKTDLKKNVLYGAGPNSQTILDKAVTVLKNVYGYNMIAVEEGTPPAIKSYIVTNNLPNIQIPFQNNEDMDNCCFEDAHRILLLLILSHIFMSNNAVTEASLYSFLKAFKIELDRKHELFGNVKDYIFNTLKTKKYIQIETDQLSKKMIFSWGPRSEKEISKHDILNFVCKMYKDRMPSSWVNQFEKANEQFQNNQEMPTE